MRAYPAPPAASLKLCQQVGLTHVQPLRASKATMNWLDHDGQWQVDGLRSSETSSLSGNAHNPQAL
jgi:hypothetical protein